MHALMAILAVLILAGCNAQPTMRSTVDVALFAGARRADGCTISQGQTLRILDRETVTEPDMAAGRWVKISNGTCTGWVRDELVKQ